jgi:hypothetical protein
MRDAARRERQARDPNFIASTVKQIMARPLPTGSQNQAIRRMNRGTLLGTTAAKAWPYWPRTRSRTMVDRSNASRADEDGLRTVCLEEPPPLARLTSEITSRRARPR